MYNEPRLPANYTQFERLTQANKDVFSTDLKKDTGLVAKVREKNKPSFNGKIKRYEIKGLNPSDIVDKLAGRIMTHPNDIYWQVVVVQLRQIVGFFFELFTVAGIFELLQNYSVVGYFLVVGQIGDRHAAFADLSNNLKISQEFFVYAEKV